MPTTNSIRQSYMNQCFKFQLVVSDGSEEQWWIPDCTVTDNSDTLTISTSWSKTNVLGSTEAITAFNYTDNPNININLKFQADSWRNKYFSDGSKLHSYSETISKLVSLAYPTEKGDRIIPPYVVISYADVVYRGYFSSVRCVQSGALKYDADTDRWIKSTCEFSGTFVVTKKYSPKQSGVASDYKTYFN